MTIVVAVRCGKMEKWRKCCGKRRNQIDKISKKRTAKTGNAGKAGAYQGVYPARGRVIHKINSPPSGQRQKKETNCVKRGQFR
jgi:hypothetical protein